MYIFRPVTVADLPAVEALAAQSPVGVTSLPANREALLHKIQASQDALAAEVRLYGEERYFFTVEDRASAGLPLACKVLSHQHILRVDWGGGGSAARRARCRRGRWPARPAPGRPVAVGRRRRARCAPG